MEKENLRPSHVEPAAAVDAYVLDCCVDGFDDGRSLGDLGFFIAVVVGVGALGDDYCSCHHAVGVLDL